MGLNIAGAEAAIGSILGKVDVPALISAGQSLIAAWPQIEAIIAAEATQLPPLIAAIEQALSGQTPTDTDWAGLDAALDVGDADIAAAGDAAQAELDRRAEETSPQT